MNCYNIVTQTFTITSSNHEKVKPRFLKYLSYLLIFTNTFNFVELNPLIWELKNYSLNITYLRFFGSLLLIPWSSFTKLLQYSLLHISRLSTVANYLHSFKSRFSIFSWHFQTPSKAVMCSRVYARLWLRVWSFASKLCQVVIKSFNSPSSASC